MIGFLASYWAVRKLYCANDSSQLVMVVLYMHLEYSDRQRHLMCAPIDIGIN